MTNKEILNEYFDRYYFEFKKTKARLNYIEQTISFNYYLLGIRLKKLANEINKTIFPGNWKKIINKIFNK